MEGREVRTDLNPIHSDPGRDREVLAPPEGLGQCAVRMATSPEVL